MGYSEAICSTHLEGGGGGGGGLGIGGRGGCENLSPLEANRTISCDLCGFVIIRANRLICFLGATLVQFLI